MAAPFVSWGGGKKTYAKGREGVTCEGRGGVTTQRLRFRVQSKTGEGGAVFSLSFLITNTRASRRGAEEPKGGVNTARGEEGLDSKGSPLERNTPDWGQGKENRRRDCRKVLKPPA